MARVFIGLGSNINPEQNVRQALRLLGREVRMVALSTFYRTQAEGPPGQPPFYNGVAQVETDIPPGRLKHSVLRRIEEELGRQRTEDKYAPRTIDLDVLLYDDLVVAEEGLRIPHPQIAQRAFLAIPLQELAPELTLPNSGRPIAEIAAALAHHKMEPLGDYTEVLRKEMEDGSRQG